MRICLFVILAITGCQEPTEEVLEAARQAGHEEGAAAGRAEGYREGLAAGRAAGEQKGLVEGRAAGQREVLTVWGPLGAAIGLCLGAFFVVFVSRERLQLALGDRRRDRRLKRLLGREQGRLDPELYAAAVQVAEAAQRVRGELARRPDLSGIDAKLDRMLGQLSSLAQLLQRLREAQRAANIEPEALRARIVEREAEQAEAPEPALAELIAAERRTLEAWERTAGSRRRCELELEALGSFFEHLAISLPNLEAIEQGELSERLDKELGDEVEQLTEILTSAMKELSEPARG